MSWQPSSPSTRPWWRVQRLPILGILLAVNVGVVVLHGDPRTRVSALGKQSPAKAQATAAPATETPAAVASVEVPAAASEQAPALASAETPAAAASQEPAAPAAATEDAGLDPTRGLRRPGRVQHVLDVTIQAGKTAAATLTDAGIAREEVASAISSLKPWVDFRRLRGSLGAPSRRRLRFLLAQLPCDT